MQEKYKGCFSFFKDFESTYGRILTESERESIYQAYDAARLNLLGQGKSLDGLSNTKKRFMVDEKGTMQERTLTNLEDELFDEIYRRNIVQVIEQYTTQLSLRKQSNMTGRIVNIKDNIKTLEPNISDKKAMQRAVVASRVETNDTINTIAPDKMYRTNISTYVGDYRRSANEVLKQNGEQRTYNQFVKEEKTNIYKEIWAFENYDTHVKHLEGSNATAHEFAKAVWNATTVRHRGFLSGVKRFLKGQREGVAIQWDKSRVSKMSREEFIAFVAPKLDQDVHVNRIETIRKDPISETNATNVVNELAGQIYDQIQDPAFNWRRVGDPTFGSKIEMRKRFTLSEKDTTPGVAWKSPDAYIEIKQRFTADSKFDQSMLSYVTELGRERTIHQLFGSNPRKALAQYEAIVNDMVGESPTSLIGAQMETSLNYLRYLVKPELLENSKMSITFSVLRNVQAAAKLGSAVITAILDIPTFLVAGRRQFGVKKLDLINQLFPGEKFNGSLAENKKYAEYIIEAAESLQDAASLRYVLNDGIGSPSAAQRGAATFANFIFKASGLSWWTKSLQSSAAGVYGKHIGELIRDGRTWDSISKNKAFIRNFQKYGINKAEWEDLLERHKTFPGGILDARGRIDLYKMGDKGYRIINGKKELIDETLSIPLRQKFSALIGDAVDTMVMKPGQFDRMAASLFADEQKFAGQIFKTLLQFKGHPITLFRKIYARGYKQDKAELAETAAYLTASLMTFSILVTQLKQFVAGREQYDPTEPELYIKAFQQAGVVGIMSDLFMIGGGETLMREALSDEKAKALNTYDIMNQMVGPLLMDILKVMSSTGGVIQGGFRTLRGKDSGELAMQNFGELAKILVATSGFQNLWQTKLLVRGLLAEPLMEFTDPRGYKRRERKAVKDARNQRIGGEANNFIFKKLFE